MFVGPKLYNEKYDKLSSFVLQTENTESLSLLYLYYSSVKQIIFLEQKIMYMGQDVMSFFPHNVYLS